MTLLIKVRTHRGDPLNEEAHIRVELDRLKEHKKSKNGTTQPIGLCTDDLSPQPNTWGLLYGLILCVTAVIRQKTGGIETFKALEIGSLKWWREHVPRDGNGLSEEGQMLLDDPELWMDLLTLLWECHASTPRKREHTTEDDTFLLHNRRVITSTITGDWLLTEGESRDKVGE